MGRSTAGFLLYLPTALLSSLTLCDVYLHVYSHVMQRSVVHIPFQYLLIRGMNKVRECLAPLPETANASKDILNKLILCAHLFPEKLPDSFVGPQNSHSKVVNQRRQKFTDYLRCWCKSFDTLKTQILGSWTHSDSLQLRQNHDSKWVWVIFWRVRGSAVQESFPECESEWFRLRRMRVWVSTTFLFCQPMLTKGFMICVIVSMCAGRWHRAS